jgi:predicted porin
MNRIVISSAVGVLFAGAAVSAFAQSSVTLYGLVDTAVRYQTNAGPDDKDLIGMTVGPETNSRWGLRGSEDLGDGLSAVFRLENQFDAFNGQLSAPNELFGRQAYVGLSSTKYGTLTFGRQYAPLYDTMGDVYDPLTVGDYWQDSWVWNGIGPYLEVNNSIKYKLTVQNFSIDAIYGFGNHAGAVGLDSTYGVELTYIIGPGSLDAGFQQTSVSTANGSSAGQQPEPYRRRLIRWRQLAGNRTAAVHVCRLLRSHPQCRTARRRARQRDQLLGYRAGRILVHEAHGSVLHGGLRPWQRGVCR